MWLRQYREEEDEAKFVRGFGVFRVEGSRNSGTPKNDYDYNSLGLVWGYINSFVALGLQGGGASTFWFGLKPEPRNVTVRFRVLGNTGRKNFIRSPPSC